MATVTITVPMYCGECGWTVRNRNDGTIDCQNVACSNHGKIFSLPRLEVRETPQAEPGNKKKEFRAVPNKSGERI